jgi:Protein of unknown function (DUF3102)
MIAGSNSLADLAARIRAEHEATAIALRRSIAHAIAAGELLIEAKDLLKHGEWLPWLRDHCVMSERTAQLYMRCSRARKEIEANTQQFADLNLNEVAALLMMSSDVRKLLNFAKEAEGLSGEALADFCLANNVSMINDPSYNPFAGRSETEKLEWYLFTIFVSYDGEAGRAGFQPEGAAYHVEYLLQRPFQNVDEWLGPEGDKWRRLYGGQISEQFKLDWVAFREAHRDFTLADADAKLGALSRQFETDRDAGHIDTPAGWRKRKRKNGRANAGAAP